MKFALGLAGLSLIASGTPLRAESAPASKAGGRPTAQKQRQVRGAIAKLPLSFEANKGQTDPRVQYLARGAGYSLFLTPQETVLRLRKRAAATKPTQQALQQSARRPRLPVTGDTTVVRLKLAGANAKPQVKGIAPLPGKANYLVGKDSGKWRRNIPTFERVRYSQVYPGIDLEHYGKGTLLEYDFIVAPRADPRQIRMQVAGADRLSVDKAGNLLMRTSIGTLRQRKPVLYQQVNGKRKPVAGSYVVRKNKEVGFQIARYDVTRPLIIDPVLDWATAVGGSGTDAGQDIDVDLEGNAYITGYTESADFPVVNAFQDTLNGLNFPFGLADAYIVKLSPDGSSTVFATYIGGRGDDLGNGIAVDTAGNVYICGTYNSDDFPFPNGGSGSLRPRGVPPESFFTAFALQLSSDGTALVYSNVFIGGNDFDEARGIVVDADGNAWVCGTTFSDDFLDDFGGTTTGFVHAGGGDAFVVQLDPAGDILYSTLLGGFDFDTGSRIANHFDGTVFVVGTTFSDDFPVFGLLADPFQLDYGGEGDAWVARIDPAGVLTGEDVLFASYLGGSAFDEGIDVTAGLSSGGATGSFAGIVGTTFSDDFPVTPGAFDTSYNGDGDAFVTAITQDGEVNSYSTFLGGSGFEGRVPESPGFGAGIARALTGGADEHVWVTGTTFSADFPLGEPDDDTSPALGGGDVFLVRLNFAVPAGADDDPADLVSSTVLGGSGLDEANSVAARPLSGDEVVNGACVVGTTFSGDFPVLPDTQVIPGGISDAFVACFTEGDVVVPPDCSGLARLSTRTVKFGTVKVGRTKRRSFNIRNTHADEPLFVSISGPDDPFFWDTDVTDFILEPGTRRVIRVEFAPQERGQATSEMVITTSDCTKEELIVTLRGKGKGRQRGGRKK